MEELVKEFERLYPAGGLPLSEYGVPNWCDFWWLYEDVAEDAKDDDILIEIGLLFGGSITYLAKKLGKKKTKLYGIDFNSTWMEWTKKSIKLLDIKNINLILKDSIEASMDFKDDSVSFIFLDSSHAYDTTRDELEVWWPKIKKGGFFAAHDYINELYPGVKKAIDEFAAKYDIKFRVIGCSAIFKPKK